MYLLEKTRAARYANLSPVDRFGFVSAADPINCVGLGGDISGATIAGPAPAAEAFAGAEGLGEGG
jgi:hypothetical protein